MFLPINEIFMKNLSLKHSFAGRIWVFFGGFCEGLRSGGVFIMQNSVYSGKYLPLILLFLWVDIWMGQIPPGAIPVREGSDWKVKGL